MAKPEERTERQYDASLTHIQLQYLEGNSEYMDSQQTTTHILDIQQFGADGWMYDFGNQIIGRTGAISTYLTDLKCNASHRVFRMRHKIFGIQLPAGKRESFKFFLLVVRSLKNLSRG
jgi:hypothetical protein